MKKSLVVALVLITGMVGASAAPAQEPSTADRIIAQERGRALDLGRTEPNQSAVPEPSTVDRIIAQERGRAFDLGLSERPVLVVGAADDGFDWADAGVGGAAVLALALLAMAGLALRPGRRQRAA